MDPVAAADDEEDGDEAAAVMREGFDFEIAAGVWCLSAYRNVSKGKKKDPLAPLVKWAVFGAIRLGLLLFLCSWPIPNRKNPYAIFSFGSAASSEKKKTVVSCKPCESCCQKTTERKLKAIGSSNCRTTILPLFKRSADSTINRNSVGHLLVD
jgi:hypothetical protein